MSDDGGNGDYVAMSGTETIDGHSVEWRRVADISVVSVCDCGVTAVSGSVAGCARLIRSKHRYSSE